MKHGTEVLLAGAVVLLGVLCLFAMYCVAWWGV